MNTVVINFNAPELNHLASHLAHRKTLRAYVRTYVNRDRLWERLLSRVPFSGGLYRNTFGRRRIGDPSLLALTREAGLATEILRAGVARINGNLAPIPAGWEPALQDKLRRAVSEEGRKAAANAGAVVAHLGFALPAFRTEVADRETLRVLNYSTVHHRFQREAVALEHQMEPEFARSWQPFDKLWKPGYEQQLDHEIALAHFVLVGSTFARDTFVRAGIAAEKLRIVPYGVDASTFHPSESLTGDGAYRVMYAGGIYQGKGLSYLLRAVQRLKAARCELTLVGNFVGGAGPFAPYRDTFIHIPHCTRHELARIYRSSDVFVFPTLSDGMGLVVLEAMASGLPVIVTPNGPGDIVRDGIDGLVIPARDEEALEDALVKLRDDHEQRIWMGRNARARALEFSWDRYACSVHSLLGGQPPPRLERR